MPHGRLRQARIEGIITARQPFATVKQQSDERFDVSIVISIKYAKPSNNNIVKLGKKLERCEMTTQFASHFNWSKCRGHFTALELLPKLDNAFVTRSG
eukprot:2343171-Pyramimonas_sp.AAC.1